MIDEMLAETLTHGDCITGDIVPLAPDGWVGDAAGRRCLARGRLIHEAGERGIAWRVSLGAVRLDRDSEDGPQFGGLALAGDVIGAEVLLFGAYTFTARALSPVVLEPWLTHQESASPRVLLQALATSENRMADALALRSGTPGRRINRLLGLIGRGLGHGQRMVRVALPQLRDIAEMTDLTVETVSRTISRLTSSGALEVSGRYRSRAVWVSTE
jgi:CRP-like cAMP-binding protein